MLLWPITHCWNIDRNTFIALKKSSKNINVFFNKTFKWQQFKGTRTFRIIAWNVGRLAVVVVLLSWPALERMLWQSWTSVRIMRGGWAGSARLGARLNLTQFLGNFHSGLTRTNLSYGWRRRSGILLSFLFVIKCWKAPLEFHRLETLRDCLFLFFFTLISPGGISFLRLDWAAQMRAGKTSKAAEISNHGDVLQPDNRVSAKVRGHGKPRHEKALRQERALMRSPNRKSQHNDTRRRWRTFRRRPFR